MSPNSSKSNGPENLPAEHQHQQLTDKAGVAKAARVSKRTVDNWLRLKKIPKIVLSPRCTRFHLPSVMAALARFTVEEVK